MLKTFPIGPGFQVQKVVGGDDRAYWLKVVTGGFEVWQTDGSEVGSGRAFTSGQLQLNSGFLPEFAMAGDQLVFSALSGGTVGLWATDGTLGSTRKLRANIPANRLTTVGNQVYFAGDDGTHGFEPWRTDGTPTGTVMIHDVDPLSSGGSVRGSIPKLFTLSHGPVYFTAIREVEGIVKPEI